MSNISNGSGNVGNVVLINENSITPRYIIEELLHDHENIKDLVVSIRYKDDTLETSYSLMSAESMALLVTNVTLDLHEHIKGEPEWIFEWIED